MRHKKAHALLVLSLCVSLLATGCNSDWISVALDDLPVLTQMALNIGSLATTLQSGQQLSASETAEIQNISSQASKDLNLLQSLYNEYRQNPNSGTLQKIQAVIADINQNLPALLQAAHVSNAALSAKVSAAVNLILVTVNSFALLIPGTSGQGTAKQANLPHATDLKKQWNHQICGPSEPSQVSINAACSLQP
jgi:hypothetical protein